MNLDIVNYFLSCAQRKHYDISIQSTTLLLYVCMCARRCARHYICCFVAYCTFAWSVYASALGSTQPCPFPQMHITKKTTVENYNPLVTFSHFCHYIGIILMTSDFTRLQRVMTSFLDTS